MIKNIRHLRRSLTRPLALALALTAVLGPAVSGLGPAAERTRSGALAAEVLSCRPALRWFCRNVHVGCAGRTRVPTAPFLVSLHGSSATLTYPGEEAPPQAGTLKGARDRIIRVTGSDDWIRIEADGRFSHRIYRTFGSAMSYGRCHPVNSEP